MIGGMLVADSSRAVFLSHASQDAAAAQPISSEDL
jgi:hypothetical protein